MYSTKIEYDSKGIQQTMNMTAAVFNGEKYDSKRIQWTIA